MNWISKLTIRFIDSYQKKGGGEHLLFVDCNFVPSCSEYAKQAIDRYGFLRGVWLGLKRIMRCNKTDQVQKIYDPIPEMHMGKECFHRNKSNRKKKISDLR